MLFFSLFVERSNWESSHYNDISEDTQGNPSQPRMAPSGAKGAKGLRRHPTLPPIPQYQTLDPSTAGVANYEPIDAEQDLNGSGLYEKLDFRPFNNGPDYVNPDKPIPEYLELVNDTNLPPGNTASTVTAGAPAKEYYQPMEGSLRNGLFKDRNSVPENYVPMEMKGSQTKIPYHSGAFHASITNRWRENLSQLRNQKVRIPQRNIINQWQIKQEKSSKERTASLLLNIMSLWLEITFVN